MRKTSLLPGIPLLLLALVGSAIGSQSADRTVSLSYISGEAYIQRVSESAFESATPETPLSTGDRLGTANGRLEIDLGLGTYLRLDRDSKIDLIHLPVRGQDRIRVRIWTGSVYILAASVSREKGFEIHTGDVSVYLLDEGAYRLNVRQTETQVYVFRGLVEAAGLSGSVMLKQTQKVEAVQGHFSSAPSGFPISADDGFDRWNESRDGLIRREPASRDLPAPRFDFVDRVPLRGEWRQFPKIGSMWIPYHGYPRSGSFPNERRIQPRTLKIYPPSPFIGQGPSGRRSGSSAPPPAVLGRIYDRISKGVKKLPLKPLIKKKESTANPKTSRGKTTQVKKKKTE